ncbi:MAG TPA: hypothetical protein PLA94_27855 [Myxococcota bacterium]|nr:hypothetical protein [Myxococcota bacterium]HND33858.1 hypothetical protein [Myxococcota bacterium]
MGTRAERWAGRLLKGGKMAWSLLPENLKKDLDDRLFYAIFQMTRVTNDAYKPPPPPPER